MAKLVDVECSVVKFVEKTNFFTLSIIISFICVFFAFPPYFSKGYYGTWETFFQQIDHPFTSIKVESYSHEAKMTFRLFPVILAKILNLNRIGVLFLLHIVGILIYWFSMRFSFHLFKEKYLSFLFTLSLAFIYFGKVSFIEQRGIFDGLALLSLILAYYYRSNFILLFLFIQFAAWTDERALVVSSFIFIDSINFDRYLLKLTKKNLSIIISWSTYLLLRYFMAQYFNLNTNSGGISLKILALNFEFFPLSFWSIFEGFWILVILYFFYIYKYSKLNFIANIFVFIVTLVISYLVVDVTRSLAFLGILIFVGLDKLSFFIPKSKFKILLYLTLFFNFLFPSYIFGGNQFVWVKPVVFEIIFQFFTNK
jgi:hypothetical protein